MINDSLNTKDKFRDFESNIFTYIEKNSNKLQNGTPVIYPARPILMNDPSDEYKERIFNLHTQLGETCKMEDYYLISNYNDFLFIEEFINLLENYKDINRPK